MTITSIVNSLTDRLNSINIPTSTLPPLLLKCISMTRPGLSAYKIASEIIQNNQKLGIPTGPNVDGSENLINAYTYNIIKCMVHALQNDASIQCAIPMNSLLIQATGANGGGSVTCIGSNLKDSISQGIIH